MRTRALATTLFARLLLADVFIHGIGGAKYDQVTDEICEDFLAAHCRPMPRFPAHCDYRSIGRQAPVDSRHQLRRELREYRFHPELHQDKMEFSPPKRCRFNS